MKGSGLESDAGIGAEGRSSSPCRGKRVVREEAGEERSREEKGWEGVPIYTSILNLLR